MLNSFLVPVRPILPLVAMFPRAQLAQANVNTSHSPILISELLLWGRMATGLHSGSRMFRGAFGGCGRKRPHVSSWGHRQEQTGICLSVLTSLALTLAVFSPLCKCMWELHGLGLRMHAEKYPWSWLSPTAALCFPAWKQGRS